MLCSRITRERCSAAYDHGNTTHTHTHSRSEHSTTEGCECCSVHSTHLRDLRSRCEQPQTLEGILHTVAPVLACLQQQLQLQQLCTLRGLNQRQAARGGSRHERIHFVERDHVCKAAAQHSTA